MKKAVGRLMLTELAFWETNQMPSETKSLHEEFTVFFETPTREGLKDLIKKNFGETNHLDFKEQWVEFPSLARHILAFGNSGGGCIIFGVSQAEDKSLSAVGIEAIKDKVDIEQGVRKFLPNQLKYETLDFSYASSEYADLIGKRFQVVIIFDLPEYLPFIAESEGKGIRRTVYVRRGTASEEADYLELQELLNKRIQTQYSNQDEFDLQKEFQELKFLFSQIDRYFFTNNFLKRLSFTIPPEMRDSKVQNPNYPQEDYEDFVKRMIGVKKKRIEGIVSGS